LVDWNKKADELDEKVEGFKVFGKRFGIYLVYLVLGLMTAWILIKQFLIRP